MTRMLVTQALDERALLEKKINDKIESASFVDVIKHNNNEVIYGKESRRDFEKHAKSSLQQLFDLIDRYQKIEAAIVASNASHYIETTYGKFTVAGAIAMRSRLQDAQKYGAENDFEGNLVDRLEEEYRDRVSAVEQMNRQLNSTAENMRLSILGRDSKVKDDKPLEVVDAYVRENTAELVDPIKIKDQIDRLRAKADTLLTELNTEIKVSNATTFIEFD